MTTRPGRGTHLLSSIARCAECGGKLAPHRLSAAQGQTDHLYWCSDHSCVGIYEKDLDAYVERIIVGWLSDPDVAADLAAADDSAAARLARADADQATVELEEWRQAAERGEITLASFTRFEQGALLRIADAKRRAQESTMPTVLAGNVGPQAAAGWEALDVTVKRQIIAAVADIRVHKVGRQGNRKVDPAYRVGWRWLLPPGDGEYIPPLSYEQLRAEQAAARSMRPRPEYVSAALRDLIAGMLRADPMIPDKTALRQSGCNYSKAVAIVRRDLEAAGEIPVIRRRGRGAPVNHGYSRQ